MSANRLLQYMRQPDPELRRATLAFEPQSLFESSSKSQRQSEPISSLSCSPFLKLSKPETVRILGPGRPMPAHTL